MVRGACASDHSAVRSFDEQAGQATLEWLAVAVGVVALSGALVTATPAVAPRITSAFQTPHLSRRRRVARGLAPHRATRAGAAAGCACADS
jgi:hypothetical protein